MKEKPEKLNLIIVTLIIILFLSLSYFHFSVFELIERNIYDTEIALCRRTADTPPQIAIIEIDDKSLALLGKWPWPGSLFAQMINNLEKNGVKLIGLNIPLKERAPEPVIDEIKAFQGKLDVYPPAQKDGDLKKWIIDNLNQIIGRHDNDMALVESMKKSGKIILPVHAILGSDEKSLKHGELFFSRSFIPFSNISSKMIENLSVSELIPSSNTLAQNALGLGHDILAADDIMQARLHPLFVSHKGEMFPSFPLRLAIAHLNEDIKQVMASGKHLQLRGKIIPLVNGMMLTGFTNSEKEFIRFSFADLIKLEGNVPALRGKTALIALNHSSSKRFKTPVSPDMPESELVAQTVSAIITNNAISRPLWIAMVEMLLLILIGFFTVALFPRKSPAVRLAWTIGPVILILTASFLLIYTMNIWFKPAYISLGLLLILLYFTAVDLFLPEKFREESLEGAIKQGKGLAMEPDDQSAPSESGEANDQGKRHALGEMRSMVGRYKIISELGKGSMGLVYKAHDAKINRMVAIKTIRLSDEFDDDVIQEIKERFFREAEIAGKLSHPSIVTIYDIGDDKDLTYIAMEYIEGKDLEQSIRKDNLLPFKNVLDVVIKIAEALDFAHKAEVIHRDIKPANVMLLNDGLIKVTDFGIAKAISSSRTKTGVILGTPNYMSPEQIMGQKIDSRSDIFSLGVLFFQLLTGELPFHGENLSGLLYQITQVKHPSPRNHNARIPKVCEQIIDKALAKDPKKRFKTAGDMARVIRLLVSRIDQIRKTKPG